MSNNLPQVQLDRASKSLHAQTLKIAIALLIMDVSALTVIARDGQRITHWLVGQTASQRVAINPVSGERQVLEFQPDKIEIISPDRKRIALLHADGKSRTAALQIAERARDGSHRNPRTLLPASEHPQEINWLPNSASLICMHGKDQSR